MTIINKEGIVPQILRAMTAKMDTYHDDKASYMKDIDADHDLSVTTLEKSPRQHQLVVRHWNEIEQDAMDLYYVTLGGIIHSILEHNPNPGDLVEHRYGRTFLVNGRKFHIHGMADTINFEKDYYKNTSDGVIEDYKFTSMSAVNYAKEGYVQQLNFLRLLLGKRRSEIKTLRNVYIFRDWRSSDVKSGRSPQPLFTKVVEQPVWSDEECAAKLKERIITHALHFDTPDDDLPECTKEELWYSREGFRIRSKTKKGEWSKVTVGWAPSEEEASVIAAEKKLTEFRFEKTEGKPKRCDYCLAKPFCSQFKRMNLPPEDQDEEVQL
jgi:hypothetical protein